MRPRNLATIIGTVAVLLVGCGGESQPVAVPDVVDLALPDAREQLDEGGLEIEEVDDSGEDRAVFSPRNWIVVSQDPAAGTDVEPGISVEVRLANVRDAADSDHSEESGDSDHKSDAQPEREAQTAEEVFAAHVKDRFISWDESNGNIAVEFEGSDNFTTNMIRRGIERDMTAAYTAVYHDPGTDAQRMTVTATFPLTDEYGNTQQRKVWTTQLEADVAERINWDEPYAVSWERIRTEIFRHPELRE